ncbi:MAG: GNAT family N-acetyltransferase [Pseudonocardia sp.]|nr:GNAT family N-acetyltransferase [Pseudonocardia sp.]
MRIRDATAADWASIWPFLRTIVRAGETYTLPRDLDEDAAREFWMRACTLVAVDGATVLGTAKIVPNQQGPGAHVANASFMVDPAHAGKGVGRALGAAVLDRARADGYRAMQFNAVVETNAGAVRLWRSLGFSTLTTVPEAFHHPTRGYVGLHVMWRSLEG